MRIFQAAVLGFLLATIGFGQSPQQTKDTQTKSATSQSARMGPSGQQMMSQYQNMMSQIQQMDSELQAKVAAMNSATGDQRIPAIVAVINEMARQRHDLFSRMQMMNSGMMTYGASHMQSGGQQAMTNHSMMGPGMGMMQGQSTAGANTNQKGKAQ
jgi:hypothetical protein